MCCQCRQRELDESESGEAPWETPQVTKEGCDELNLAGDLNQVDGDKNRRQMFGKWSKKSEKAVMSPVRELVVDIICFGIESYSWLVEFYSL